MVDDCEEQAKIEYSKVMDRYAVGEITLTVDPAKVQKLEKPKSALVLCLDKSGSMGGEPINAVRKGAYDVAKMHSETNTFDWMLTITFDNNWNLYLYKNLNQYEEENNKLQAGGGTDFSEVFKTIQNKYNKNDKSTNSLYNYSDCTIMFIVLLCLWRMDKQTLKLHLQVWICSKSIWKYLE